MQLYEIRIILYGERETADGALRAIGDLFDEEMGQDNYGATLYEGVQGETTEVTIPADSPLIVTDDRSVDEILDSIEANLDKLIDSFEYEEEERNAAPLRLVTDDDADTTRG